jgi:hypothetical protein
MLTLVSEKVRLHLAMCEWNALSREIDQSLTKRSHSVFLWKFRHQHLSPLPPMRPFEVRILPDDQGTGSVNRRRTAAANCCDSQSRPPPSQKHIYFNPTRANCMIHVGFYRRDFPSAKPYSDIITGTASPIFCPFERTTPHYNAEDICNRVSLREWHIERFSNANGSLSVPSPMAVRLGWRKTGSENSYTTKTPWNLPRIGKAIEEHI